MLSLKSLVKVSVIALSLVGMNSVFAEEQQLHGMRTSVDNARSLAARDYRDGTNVMLVNWSHRMIDVVSPATGDTVVLNPIGYDGNTFYLYSSFFYPSIYLEVYDHVTGERLSSGNSNNPSTLEIRDGFGFRSTEDSKVRLVVSNHKGL